MSTPAAVPTPTPAAVPGRAARVLIGLVTFYRQVWSPRSLPSCRYLPTCSEYALDAVRLHGAGRGGLLAVRRVLRCHPLHAGGYDPVPPAAAPGRPVAPGSPVAPGRPAAPRSVVTAPGGTHRAAS